VAGWASGRVILREVKARAAVRARVGPYEILDSLSPPRARLQSPLEHVDGAQSKRPTTHRAEQIPPSGTLPEGVVFKQYKYKLKCL
jgi:hypothetical protein